jgi:hypothetical protein
LLVAVDAIVHPIRAYFSSSEELRELQERALAIIEGKLGGEKKNKSKQ